MTLGAAILASLLVASPPSGRPPIGPLERYEPRMYDFTFEVAVSTVHQRDALDRQYYHLVDAPIVMPIIFQGTYSRVEHDSLAARLWLGQREDRTLAQRTRLDKGQPHHTRLAVIPIVEFRGQSLRWHLSYRVHSWSSRINDAGAATIAWPKEWPSEVADGLKPQQYIESNDPVFAQAVEHVSQGQLRLVPPYLAAKDLVRYCINEIKVSGNGTHRGALGVLHGLEIVGASQAAADHRGGPHDLVCVCVAMLRAAGIPARPVIGVYKDDRDRSTFVSWAEFFLPDAGWIPFDPAEMRGKGVRHLGVREAWPEFGTMKDLNRRIPLAYHFIPPVSVESPQNPAVWGWDPRPGRDPSSKQQIRLSIVSRGRAPEDPH